MSRATHLLPLWAFVACSRETFTFTFTFTFAKCLLEPGTFGMLLAQTVWNYIYILRRKWQYTDSKKFRKETPEKRIQNLSLQQHYLKRITITDISGSSLLAASDLWGSLVVLAFSKTRMSLSIAPQKPVYTLQSYDFKTNFNIILHLRLGAPKRSHCSRFFRLKYCMHFSSVSCMLYVQVIDCVFLIIFGMDYSL